MTDTPTNIFDKAVETSTTELWTPISRIEKSEDDPDVRIVYGLVSDTSVDADKQRCDGEWLRGALTKWFNEWGNIREMHQPKAVGRAVSLVEEDTNRWFLTSRIVDKEAVKKLDEGVLQGYSINVFWPKLRKDPTSAAALGLICGGDIGETSLVDRPANNNSKIALMKAVGYETPTDEKFVPTSYTDSESGGTGGIADTEYGVGTQPRDDEEAAKSAGCDCSDPCTDSDCTCSDSKCTKCAGASPSIEKSAKFLQVQETTRAHLLKRVTEGTITKSTDIPDLLRTDELGQSHLAFMAAEIIRQLLVREAAETDPSESKVDALTPLASIYDCLMNIAREEYQEAFSPIMKMGGVLAALLPPPEDEPMSDEIREDVIEEGETVEETPETPIDKSLSGPAPTTDLDQESPIELLKTFKVEMETTLAAKTAQIEALTAQLEELGNRAAPDGPLIADISKSIGTSARLTKLADLKNRAAKSFEDAKHNPDMMLRSASFSEYSALRHEIDVIEKE